MELYWNIFQNHCLFKRKIIWMKDLKKIKLKSGFYLSLFVMLQMSGLFFYWKENSIFEVEEIQQNIWVYFNIITIITILMGFTMGRIAVDRRRRSSESDNIGMLFMFILNMFIVSSSSIIFYGYYMFAYETHDLSSYIITLIVVFFMSMLVCCGMLVMSSLFFGFIYTLILEDLLKSWLENITTIIHSWIYELQYKIIRVNIMLNNLS